MSLAAYWPPISEGWLQAQPELKPTPNFEYTSSCCEEHMARSSVGTPCAPRYGATAPISLEASGPSTMSTPWASTSWRACERATVGSFWVSAQETWIGRPLTVPPKSLRPRLNPCCSAFALPETGPVNGTRKPTLIGERSVPPLELVPPPQAVTTTARAARIAARVLDPLPGSFTSTPPPLTE